MQFTAGRFCRFLRVWDSREKDDTRKRDLVIAEGHAFGLNQIELSPAAKAQLEADVNNDFE